MLPIGVQEMNYLDLFSGIGGFSLGLQQAGFKFNNHFYSEIDKYAEQVYRKQFPEAIGLGAVESIKPEELPRIDLCTFGFPCQDISIAGKRAGLKGSRSGLFFEATRIINVCKPKYFIFENVKGLFSSDNGECFKACLQEIADIGYDGQWQLLNTRWWLPQNRERIYFVGYPRTSSRPQIFPIGEGNGKITSGNQKTRARIIDPKYLKRDCRIYDEECPTMTSRDYKEPFMVQVGQIGEKDSEATRVYSPDGIARTIKNGDGQGAKTGLYRVGNKNPSGKGQSGNIYDPSGIFPSIMAGGGNPNRKRDIGYSMGNIWLDNNQRTMLEVAPTINKIGNLKGEGGHECHNVHDPKGIAPTVRENYGKITMVRRKGIRRLTPIECERLQGFPDGWTSGLADTQRYKTLGNAVSVPVVKAVVERLIHKSSKSHNIHKDS